MALPARLAPDMGNLRVAAGANAKIAGFGRRGMGIQTPHRGPVAEWANGFLIRTDKKLGAPLAPIPTIVCLVIAAFNQKGFPLHQGG